MRHDAEGMSSMWAYAGEFLAEQWRVVVNFILIAVTQITIAILAQNVVQRRKHSQKPEIIYWTVKMLIQDLFLAIIMGGYMESHGGIYTFYIILKVITSVTNFLILYYTYEGDAVKTALFGMGAELASVSIGGVSMVVVYRGEADLQQIAYLYPVTWRSLLFSALCFASFAVIFLLFGKYLKRLRDYHIKHKKIWMTFFIIYISIALAQVFLEYSAVVANAYAFNFLISAFSGAVIILTALRLYGKYRRQIFRENEFLKTRRRLMLLHMEAVREQILRMESEQKMIDAQMDEIQKLEQSKDGSKRIEKYLETLKESYRMIQAGAYSDDFLVDAVLYHYGQILAEKEMQPEFSFGGYRKRSLLEENTAEILMNLLEIGMTENISLSGDKETRFLRIQGATVKNQVVFRMECGRRNGKWREKYGISYGALKRCVKRLGGQTDIVRSPERVQIQVALERK